MKSSKTVFMCNDCGYTSPRWSGKCPSCEKFNTFVEEKIYDEKTKINYPETEAVPINSVSSLLSEKTPTDISELDRVLGGGVTRGAFILLAGPPGIGKSTFLIQIAFELAKKADAKVLFVSAEESDSQVASRAKRLGKESGNIFLLRDELLERIMAKAEKLLPDVIIIDSIQTVYSEDLDAVSGTVSQIRECAVKLLNFSKRKNITVFLSGHITKEGQIAGPKVLEHIVDTVLYLETEKGQDLRILRSSKNRFGPTSEIGIFQMSETGLTEAKNFSRLFLHEREVPVPGETVVTVMEGTRTIFMEVQSLITQSFFNLPRRQIIGIDFNRTLMLLAVIAKRLGIGFAKDDLYINVTGGLKVKETSVDLGVIISVVSAHANFALPRDLVMVGEVGLLGEVRRVGMLDLRLKDMENLGFKSCIIPKSGIRKSQFKNLEIHEVTRISEALDLARELSGSKK